MPVSSGVAGAKATRERYADAGLTKMPFDGIHSISVPGAVAVYESLDNGHAMDCHLSHPQ